jgi:cell division septation protein DedD
MKPLPPIVQPAPSPAVPLEAAVDPNAAASLPLPGASAISVKDTAKDFADKSESAVPVPPDRPYAIKVSYTQDFRIAEEAVAALKAQGHEAYSAKVDLQKKGIWYRIFIGPFASEKEARQYIRGKNIAAVCPDWMIYKDTEFVARAPKNKDKP